MATQMFDILGTSFHAVYSKRLEFQSGIEAPCPPTDSFDVQSPCIRSPTTLPSATVAPSGLVSLRCGLDAH